MKQQSVNEENDKKRNKKMIKKEQEKLVYLPHSATATVARSV